MGLLSRITNLKTKSGQHKPRLSAAHLQNGGTNAGIESGAGAWPGFIVAADHRS